MIRKLGIFGAKYKSLTMDEAQKIFENVGDYIILDVRGADEFASGHIPGAINVPNEHIAQEPIRELPDKKQTIYVYCKSGMRSKAAAKKLVALGYSKIVYCGGIADWKGPVE